MKYITILFLLFTFINSGDSQDLILTKEQNDIWIENLKSKKLSKKISLINQRIDEDQNTIMSSFNNLPLGNIRGKIKTQKKEITSKEPETKTVYYSPIYVFTVKDFDYLYKRVKRNPKLDYNKLLQMNNLLIKRNINDIEIMDHPQATALYGTSASFGVIQIELKSDQILDQIIKIFKS